MRGSAHIFATGSRGSTLLVALVTVATLSFAAGTFIVAITARSRVAFQSASWHQASLAADSAANLAIAEIRRVLPESVSLPADRWSGWTSSTGTLPVSRTLDPGTVLSFTPPPLVSVDGSVPAQSGSVLLDAPVVDAGRQWLRIRARGTSMVPGGRQVSPHKLDNRLRRLAFLSQPGPQVTRTVELMVRPVLPFEAAVLTGAGIDISSATSLVDSFDSSDASASTSGEYDSLKRRSRGSLYTNSASFTFAGELYGAVGTNGGTVAPSSSLRGTIDNGFFQHLPPVSLPSEIAELRSSPPGFKKLVGGTLTAPKRYRLTELAGDVMISGDNQPGAVEIWIEGNLTGSLKVDATVKATIYVGGNVHVNALDLDNRSRRAANLQIYGLPAPSGQTRSIEITLGRDIHAAIYAPTHSLRLTGNGAFMGSLVTQSIEATARAEIHFDEALARCAAPIIDYCVASWVENVQ